METNTRELNKSEWAGYFDAVSKGLRATSVDVTVLGADLGAQPEGLKLPLIGLTYDQHDDALDVITDDLEHRIHGPSSIFVQEDASGRLVCCEVTDSDQRKQILQLGPRAVSS